MRRLAFRAIQTESEECFGDRCNDICPDSTVKAASNFLADMHICQLHCVDHKCSQFYSIHR